jgi:hypothetical protein
MPTTALVTWEHLTMQNLDEPELRWVCDSPLNTCSGPDSPLRLLDVHRDCGMAVVRKFTAIGVAWPPSGSR